MFGKNLFKIPNLSRMEPTNAPETTVTPDGAPLPEQTDSTVAMTAGGSVVGPLDIAPDAPAVPVADTLNAPVMETDGVTERPAKAQFMLKEAEGKHFWKRLENGTFTHTSAMFDSEWEAQKDMDAFVAENYQ